MTAISHTVEQARRLHQAGKLAEAERAYRQAIQANGHDAETLYLLGEALQGQGRLGEAAERYRQALELQPGHVAARAGLGVTLAGMRKLPEAVAELLQVVRQRPDFAQGHERPAHLPTGPGRRIAYRQFRTREDARRASPCRSG